MSKIRIEDRTDHTGRVFKSIAEMCRAWNIERRTYSGRINSGLSKEEALTRALSWGTLEERTDHEGVVFGSVQKMCEHWGIEYNTYKKRINSRWSKERALNTVKKCSSNEEDRTDHEGRVFDTIKELCEYWNIRSNVYMSRIKKYGWSKEDALTTPSEIIPKEDRTDHEGRVFESIKSMCNNWGINNGVYSSRVKAGWDKERALTESSEKVESSDRTDHEGRMFDSISEMCRYWEIGFGAYESRINKLGWSKEKALTTNTRKSEKTDHEGTTFDTVKDMCKHWGIDYKVYRPRVEKSGWGKREALTTPVMVTSEEKRTDHTGIVFDTIDCMCNHWGIDYTSYKTRIRKGWSKERALTEPNLGKEKTIDHLGNVFDSIEMMCKYWGVKQSAYKYRVKIGFSTEDALGINGRWLELRVKSGEMVTETIKIIGKAYIGIDNIDYYDVIDSGVENIMSKDEIVRHRNKYIKSIMEKVGK